MTIGLAPPPRKGDRDPVGLCETRDAFAPLEAFERLILAVSGGPDSMALLHLVNQWWQEMSRPLDRLLVVTVDHGLRAESAGEAALVAQRAKQLGLAHRTVNWDNGGIETGVQDAARRARYGLLRACATQFAGTGSRAIATAHTRDDQVETFLMNLARGSGLDGLSGMRVVRPLDPFDDAMLVRPLLAFPKSRLVETLNAIGWTWIEDPSNTDPAFERVRVRNWIETLGALPASTGLANAWDGGFETDAPEPLRDHEAGTAAIARSIRRLSAVRAAFDAQVRSLAAQSGLELNGGAFASMDWAALKSQPGAVTEALFSQLIAGFGGGHVPTRLSKIEALSADVTGETFTGATVGGCSIRRFKNRLAVMREAGRFGAPERIIAPGETHIFDNRFAFRLDRAASEPLRIAAGAVKLSEADEAKFDARWRFQAWRNAYATLPFVDCNGEWKLAIVGAGGLPEGLTVRFRRIGSGNWHVS